MHADRRHHARGCLLGLAVGDAIGTTVEFEPRGSFAPLTDMVGGGPFQLQPGQWTDDTSMALCLGASLLETGFDVHDQMTRYVRWMNEGYMSSTGRCFDIGHATHQALARFTVNGNPLAGDTDAYTAGNGCLMRLAPVPIRYAHDPVRAATLSVEQAKTTHGAVDCLIASRLFGTILTHALQGGRDKTQVLLSNGSVDTLQATPRLQAIATGQYFDFEEEQVIGSGYVVDSLQAALWCFYTTDNFRGAVLAAANLGDDADTTAAITGQLAGAYYGEADIPLAWRMRLAMADEIGAMAEQLFMMGRADTGS